MKNSRSIRNTLIYALLLVALAVFFVTSFTRNSDNVPPVGYQPGCRSVLAPGRGEIASPSMAAI